jgi:hypothetical protein
VTYDLLVIRILNNTHDGACVCVEEIVIGHPMKVGYVGLAGGQNDFEKILPGEAVQSLLRMVRRPVEQ